jgi:hypothetical protein
MKSNGDEITKERRRERVGFDCRGKLARRVAHSQVSRRDLVPDQTERRFIPGVAAPTAGLRGAVGNAGRVGKKEGRREGRKDG